MARKSDDEGWGNVGRWRKKRGCGERKGRQGVSDEGGGNDGGEERRGGEEVVWRRKRKKRGVSASRNDGIRGGFLQ